MARKPSPDAPDTAALKDHIRDSANHIWLAGLGAFAKAQQEGGKVFESLIKDGLHMQQQTQQVAEEKIAQATHTMSNLASQFTERAGGSWDRLETAWVGHRPTMSLHCMHASRPWSKPWPTPNPPKQRPLLNAKRPNHRWRSVRRPKGLRPKARWSKPQS